MSENKNMITCSTCGEEIAKSAKTCPKCGARMKKPWYKKWWAWVIIVVVIGAVFGKGSKNKKENTDALEQINSIISEQTGSVSETAVPAQTEEPTQAPATAPTAAPAPAPTQASAPAVAETPAPTPTQAPAPVENNAPESSQPAQELVNGMRPEFKEALDSYEDFFDEYCEFMKKYKENPGDLQILSDYADFMKQYNETIQKMDALNDGNLNDAELKYYIQVTNRINEKLVEVAL